jgi:peptide/nickel transport system ATP-binding protein
VGALEQVQLSAARERLRQYPHQLSGGMRQRVTSAIALAGQPRLLIADEPTTALDVTTQARYLQLLWHLQQETGFALLLVAHDLQVVRHSCEHVAVMYSSQIVEEGRVEDVFAAPDHPYTRALLAANPVVGDRVDLRAIAGQAPGPADVVPGCRFSARCAHATERCESARPPLGERDRGRRSRCWGTEAGGWIPAAGLAIAPRSRPGGLAAVMPEPVPVSDVVSDVAADTPGTRSAPPDASGRQDAPVPVPGAANTPAAPAVAGTGAGASDAPADALVQLRDVTVRYRLSAGLVARREIDVLAVDGVSLSIAAGHTLGLVGGTGSGKSTVAQVIMGMVQPTSGSVVVSGRSVGIGAGDADCVVQVVLQDPYSSLDPRMRAADIIAEPLTLGRRPRTRAARVRVAERVSELIELVGLPADKARSYPYQFSGGQRQRLAIARALAPEPHLVVLDEPTSALDVSVRAQILTLLKGIQARLGVTYLVISHDLLSVAYLASEVAVMHQGRIVEVGPTETIFRSPRHAYTQELLAGARHEVDHDFRDEEDSLAQH